MVRLAGAGNLCGTVFIAILLLARVGHCRTPAAQSATSRESSAPGQLAASTGATANPLRKNSLVPATSSPSPEKNVVGGTFVPAAGGPRLFRASDSNATGKRADNGSGSVDRTAAPRGGLFVPSKLLPTYRRTPRVMRYEDVARGLPLVPVKPPQRPTPAPPQPAAEKSARSTPSAGQPLANSSTSPSTPPMKIERLPPVIRAAPRPQLPAGVELPQQPIEIYPDTGK
jgi:hypothetical protein